MTRPPFLFTLALVASLLSTTALEAATSRLSPGFMKMEPRTRSLQICNNKGSREIAKEKEFSRLDRVVVDAMSNPAVESNVISGDGGAFRSKGQWHQFQFKCILAQDRLSATSFTYQIGDIIPEDQWERYGLWR